MRITAANVRVLQRIANKADASGRAPNRFAGQSTVRHARRLLAAGLIRLDGDAVVITSEGKAALATAEPLNEAEHAPGRHERSAKG